MNPHQTGSLPPVGRVRSQIKNAAQHLCSRSPFNQVICWHGSRSSGRVALTFDDGPHPTYTPRVLDLLARHRASATFFFLGQRVLQEKNLVREVVAAGHELGIHGWDHTREGLGEQTAKTQDAFRELGLSTQLFRPPGGHLTRETLVWMVRHRYTTVLWSLDSLDAARKMGWAQDEDVNYQHLRGGDIVLFHDDNDLCMREAPTVLAQIADAGWQATTISELLKSKKQRTTP